MRRLLVLWDVDYTLVDSDGVGRELYQIAFREMFGRPMPQPGSMSGRTDRAIAIEVLGLAGLVRQRSRVLPGAAQAVAALAGPGPGGDGAAGTDVVQSLLTGNIRPLAEIKLGPLGLTDHLDLDVGAYGDAHEVRAELVPLARGRAARAYGTDFGGPATVLVGDTPLDVAAALATGARAVGVATGQFTAAELAASGAHAVLPDLADTGQVVAAVLGPSRG